MRIKPVSVPRIRPTSSSSEIPPLVNREEVLAVETGEKGMFLKFIAVALVALAATSAVFTQSIQSNNDEIGGRCSGGDDRALIVIGLTSDQRLICFNERNPRKTRTIGVITGLNNTDTALIGIDFRVQDSKLYGVGNGGGVYTIDTEDASAKFVNSLTQTLDGTLFGVDFNPAADRLRVISNTGQNLRHNVIAGGTLSDGILTYTAPPAAPVAALGLTGAAYTNNDLDANTATTLFDVDTNLDQIAIQSPANNGILVSTGKLGFDANTQVGFDIYSTVKEGVTIRNSGFAALTATDGVVRFYSISLLTGKASLRGSFRSSDQVIDIAVPLDQR